MNEARPDRSLGRLGRLGRSGSCACPDPAEPEIRTDHPAELRSVVRAADRPQAPFGLVDSRGSDKDALAFQNHTGIGHGFVDGGWQPGKMLAVGRWDFRFSLRRLSSQRWDRAPDWDSHRVPDGRRGLLLKIPDHGCWVVRCENDGPTGTAPKKDPAIGATGPDPDTTEGPAPEKSKHASHPTGTRKAPEKAQPGCGGLLHEALGYDAGSTGAQSVDRFTTIPGWDANLKFAVRPIQGITGVASSTVPASPCGTMPG